MEDNETALVSSVDADGRVDPVHGVVAAREGRDGVTVHELQTKAVLSDEVCLKTKKSHVNWLGKRISGKKIAYMTGEGRSDDRI